MVNWIFYIRGMEFIYNDEFSNGVIIEDNGDGFAVAIESKSGKGSVEWKEGWGRGGKCKKR